jgi:ABC-2 type transport system ATP-binding protein
MAEAEKLCNLVAVIRQGRLLAVGNPAELRTRSGQGSLEEAFLTLMEEEQ